MAGCAAGLHLHPSDAVSRKERLVAHIFRVTSANVLHASMPAKGVPTDLPSHCYVVFSHFAALSNDIPLANSKNSRQNIGSMHQ